MREKYVCQFCKKDQEEVSLMIAGPEDGQGICDKCVELCVEIIFSEARCKNLVALDLPKHGDMK